MVRIRKQATRAACGSRRRLRSRASVRILSVTCESVEDVWNLSYGHAKHPVLITGTHPRMHALQA